MELYTQNIYIAKLFLKYALSVKMLLYQLFKILEMKLYIFSKKERADVKPAELMSLQYL